MGSLHILSRSSEMFADREQAGKLLAVALSQYRNVIVLGIPRGGVVVARVLAGELKSELDVVIVRKLRTPFQPELAMGAVAEDGKLFLNDHLVYELGISEADIQVEKERQLAELRRRAALFRGVRPRVPLEGRIVIITDDGVATGSTTQAALWAVRAQKPERLVAAIPVGPEDTIRRLANDVDEMVCLRCPPDFAGVGQFYERFEPVEDKRVLEILQEESKTTVHF